MAIPRTVRPVAGLTALGTTALGTTALGTTALSTAALGTAALGTAALGYGWCEARMFTTRQVTMPVLPRGAATVRVLHLSDLHLTPYQRRKLAWIASLAAWKPDLVINTGDNLAHHDAVPPLLEALGPLLDVPGVYVLGSNDYFEPTLRNPVGYLLPDTGKRFVNRPQLPWPLLEESLSGRGWVSLQNRTASVEVAGLRIAFAGVDDPHLRYDDLAAVAGPADAGADLRLAVAHAPYLRVLDAFAADGYDAIIAGHTHGGQLRVPWFGALVTNCDLEPARARGLSRHPAASRHGEPGSAYLHVSAGAGTSPYAAVRICCRPEASLLRLVAAA